LSSSRARRPKNKTLQYNADGSLTLYAGATSAYEGLTALGRRIDERQRPTHRLREIPFASCAPGKAGPDFDPAFYPMRRDDD